MKEKATPLNKKKKTKIIKIEKISLARELHMMSIVCDSKVAPVKHVMICT